MKKYLIITSALNTPKLNSDQLVIRLADYRSGFYHVLRFKDNFDTITLIECLSKENIKEFEEFKDLGINTYYSTFDNHHKNKGANELCHIWDFIKEDFIDEEDIIVKITGRYILNDVNILTYFNDNNIDVVVKTDKDVYHNSASTSVHSFFLAVEKNSLEKCMTIL